MKEKVIGITGAGGFIGRHFVHRLTKEGYKVKAFVRRAGSVSFLAPEEKLEIVEGDICDAEKIEYWVKGCDAVIHLAAGTRGEWKDYYHATVKGIETVLKLAEKHGVKSLIHMSSVSIYDLGSDPRPEINELSPMDRGLDARGFYARTKAIADRKAMDALEGSRVNIAVLRAGLVYAENMPSPLAPCGMFRGAWGISPGLKHKRVPFVHIDDLYRASMTAISRNAKGAWNIVHEYQPSASEMLKAWNKTSKRKVRMIFLPKTFFAPFLWMGNVFPRRSFLGRLAFLVSRTQKNAYYSPAKARQELGSRAETGFQEALKEIAEFREGKIRMAIIGCGFAARTLHVPALRGLPRAQVVAIFDANQEAASAFQAEYFPSSRVIASLSELKKMNIDLATVAVPPQFHAEVLKALIKMGIPSIVEKPALLSSSEVVIFQQEALKTGVRVAVAHNYRFRRATLEFMEVARSKNELPNSINVKFWSGPVYEGAGSWRSRMPYALLYEMGYHFLDIAGLAGAGGKVKYILPKYQDGLLISLKSGMAREDIETHIDMRIDPPYSRTEIEAGFRDESLVLRFYPENFFRLAGSVTPAREAIISIKGIIRYILSRVSKEKTAHALIYESMIRAIKSPAERPPVTLADTLPVMEMIEALVKKCEAK